MGVEPCSLGFEQSEEGKKASLKRPNGINDRRNGKRGLCSPTSVSPGTSMLSDGQPEGSNREPNRHNPVAAAISE